MGLITELIRQKIIGDNLPAEKVKIQLTKENVIELKIGKAIVVKQNHSLYIVQIKSDQLHKSQFLNEDYQIREINK